MTGSTKRFTWKRAGLALLLLAVLAWAGIYALLRSDWLTEQIRLRVIAEVEQATGGVVELEALRFDPSSWTLELINLRIRDRQKTEPFLAVPKTSLAITVLSFLSPNVRLDSVTLERPLLQLTVAEDGSTNWPTRVVDGPSSKITDIGLGRLSITQGSIDFNGEPYALDIAAQDIALNVVMSQEKCYAVTGQAQSLEGVADGMDLSGAVSADLRLCDNSLEVRSAELITATLGTWRASGSAAPLADPSLDFELSFEAPLASRILDLPDGWRVEGTAEGSARLTRASGEEIAYSGEVHAVSVDVQGPEGSITNNRLDAAFEGDLDALAFSDFSLQMPRAGRVMGQGRIEGLREQPSLTANGTLNGVRVGRLLRTFTPRFVWATQATGSFELTASEQAGGLISAVAAFSEPGDAVRPGMVGNTDFTFSSVGRVLQLRRFEATAEGVDLTATGRVSEYSASDVLLELQATSQEDVERLLAVAGYATDSLPIRLHGPVQLTADVSSPRGLSQPAESQVSGQVSTAAIELHDYRWDSLNAQVQFDNSRLTVVSGRLVDGEGSVDLSGTADITSGSPAEWPLDVDLAVNGLAIPKLLSAAQLTTDVQGQLSTEAASPGRCNTQPPAPTSRSSTAPSQGTLSTPSAALLSMRQTVYGFPHSSFEAATHCLPAPAPLCRPRAPSS